MDDDLDLLALLEDALSLSGFAVTSASGGREALTALNGGPAPDAILLDIQMPFVDGWDTLTALRADPRFSDTAVIMLTARTAPANKIRGWELGCDAFVTKPFDTRDLARQVLEVVSLSTRERADRRELALAAAIREVAARG